MSRNYWAMRTDSGAREYLLTELSEGRLRQGWGYEERLDLNTIAKKLGEHGWRVASLDAEERSTWRGNQRLWSGHWGRIAVGDVIVVPKMPTDRHWTIVEVTGEYSFDLDEEVGDYGHVLPVRQLAGNVSNANRLVTGPLIATMKCRSRLWNISSLSEDVEALIGTDGDLTKRDTDIERLQDVMDEALASMRSAVEKRFSGSDLESPVQRLLERLYGRGAVQRRAGPKERGADFEITSIDPLGTTFTTVVQLKAYRDEIGGTRALDQIRDAVREYGAHAGVVLTTADGETKSFREARLRLEAELEVPIRLVGGEELARLFLANLGDLLDQPT